MSTHLNFQGSLNENDSQKVARYLYGLKPDIKDHIGLQVVRTIDEAHNMALKAESLEKKLMSSGFSRDVYEPSSYNADEENDAPISI